MRVCAKPKNRPCTPSNTVRGPKNPLRASSAARNPDCAAQPACRRLVQAPSARYSMMPLAIEPTLPSASTSSRGLSLSAAPTPAAAATAPNTAVGWKPALWVLVGATRLSRHMHSTPTAMPRRADGPSGLCRSSAAIFHARISATAISGSLAPISSVAQAHAAEAGDAVDSDDDRKGDDEQSEEHTSELQSRENLVCRLLLEKK